MTFLGKRAKAVQMERELFMWWTLSKRAWQIFRANPHDPELDEIRDEAEVLREMTEWPFMRVVLDRALERDDRLRFGREAA